MAAIPIKTAAYLCAGCGLGQRLDVQRLESVARKEGKAALVRTHEFLCSTEGVQAIRDDIEKEGVTQVAIAACSRRAKAEAFDFPGIAMARANLREGVIWARPDAEDARETTQEMAEDYVRMACAEASKLRLPQPLAREGMSRTVLVVGGGLTGLTAALEAADAGCDVALVEKSERLGGHAAELWKDVPAREPLDAPVASPVQSLAERAASHPRISLYLRTRIAETRGAPGRFEVKLDRNGEGTETIAAGAIVQATGYTPYDPAKLPELGGSRVPGVMDQAGFEALARATLAQGKPLVRPSDGAPVARVAFVQCAGQRDATGQHLPYCSGHCCATSIKQAMYLRDASPAIEALVLYTDLRVPGQSEDFYRSAQRKGVTFAKGQVSGVEPASGGCSVRFRDLILDEDVELACDLVVLATGQVPNSGVDIELPDEAEAKKSQVSILNLAYRQGPDLPQLRHGFTDSHFICFPYETRRTGIYSAGPVRRPMDSAQAMQDATGAALKAIQAIENAAAGRAAHPRSGDLSYPRVRLEGCTQCKRCTVECPFGAIDEDEKRYPMFNETRCRRCGTCMGACPVRVISFDNYSVDTVGAQIKAVDMPDEFSEKPRILLLACENDAYPALDMAGAARRTYSAFVRAIPVRCLGSVNTIWITDALNAGYDGVMLMGCRHGVEYQCHFVKGSELASYRMGKIDDTLKQLGLEPERVATFEVAITDGERVASLIEEYAAKINELGMSPLKGFA
ncbi:MAG: FAD-dependent oxidoreductase [Betaproteobacteria bacterium]